MHSSRRAFLSTSLASTAYAWQASSNVLLPSDPSRSQMWAAKGLASLAPARLEIRTADLGEGFRLTTSRTSVVIEGGRDRGCLYGAMELLERVGYRWFTSEHARVPAHVVIPKLELERRPPLVYREAFFTEAQDGDWSARNRLNGHFHHLEAQHGGRYFFQPWAHSFVELIPPTSFFAQHPEYFALVEGKRRADAQLCLSNPDVIRLSIQRVREWIAAHPDASAYSVSQNDNADWCECEQCASLGPTTSDRLLQFVNRIAREFPDKTIDTLAYQDTRRPPRSTVPAPNVLIRFCPIEACQAHPLGRCRESIDAFHDYEGWRRTAKHIVLWRYSANFSHFLAPFPNLSAVAQDLQLPRIEGAFVQGAGNGPLSDGAELRAYLAAKLLWDPHADVKRHMREFLQGVYGGAAQAMARYWKLQQRVTYHAFPNDGLDSRYLTPQLLTEGRRLLREADQVASPKARKLIQRHLLSLDYIEAMRARRFHVVGSQYEPADTQAQSKVTAMLGRAKELGVPALREDVPLDRHSALLQESTRAYRTVTLFSTGMSLVAVPELDGRIVSVRSSRGEHLSPTDVGEWAYPYAGGIFARIFPDPPREWMLEESNGKLAMMTRNGPMEARLEYELLGNAVHCLCTVRNIGNRPLDARIVWQVARGKHPEVKASPETTLAQNQVLSFAQSYEF